MAYTLGLDFGTLSGRCVVVSCEDGSIVANVAMNYPHAVMSEYIPTSDKHLPADYALQVPDDYKKTLEYTVSTAVKESGVDPREIIGICVDFTTCTVFPIDKNATPLCEYAEFEKDPHAYVKLWKHHAAEPYAERINKLLEKYPDDHTYAPVLRALAQEGIACILPRMPFDLAVLDMDAARDLLEQTLMN